MKHNTKITHFQTTQITTFYSTISQRIRTLREERGISQLDMALSIDIQSVAFYSNCECNRYGKHFNLEHIYKICKVLDITIEELFAGL